MTPMTQEEREAYLEACEQTDAIFALEGFEVTEEIKAIREAVMAGRVTNSQVSKELAEYATQHKTTEGFLESRTWT